MTSVPDLRRTVPGGWFDRLLWPVLGVALLISGSGVLWRPVGSGWAYAYDIGAYNAVYLAAAALCWRAGRGHRNGARALAAALCCNVVGNVLYSSVVAGMDPEPFPSIADAFYLLLYPFMYVAVLGAVRARVARLLPSMWLDGLVAALGTAAVAVAALLGPALELAGDNDAAIAANLAYPLADLLLLALLVAAAAILGLRLDWGLGLLGAGIGLYLVADIVYLQQVADGTYVEGTALDQVWLLGAATLALAIGVPPASAVETRVEQLGWRVLAVPVLCSLASGAVLSIGFGSRLPQLAGWCAVLCWLTGFTRTALTFRDIRDLRDVQQQARSDDLTGLPNRRALYEHWADRSAEQGGSCLILFDLDGFKDVNDTFGHHAGDQLLRAVAARVRKLVESDVLFVRLGGDEFAVLLTGGTDVGRELAVRMRAVLVEPYTVEGVTLHVDASFGLASDDATDADLGGMLRRADVAMYEAKRSRSGIAVFSAELGNGLADRLRTVEELRIALTAGQLLVHLQPIRDVESQTITAVEALVRWQHPQRGLLSPADLLPAAERAGLMRQLAAEVLDLSLSAAALWWPHVAIPVAVNLSVVDVADVSLPAKVAEALIKHGLPPEALTVELVEDTFMSEPVIAGQVLRSLQSLGVGVAIDDYGTGYSSLAYLHDIPANQLKIDRAFTSRVVSSPRTRLIIEHTVTLAHALGLDVVAEGVEDQPSLDALRALGCNLVQGFHTGRPLPVQDTLALLLPAASRSSLPSPRQGRLQPGVGTVTRVAAPEAPTAAHELSGT